MAQHYLPWLRVLAALTLLPCAGCLPNVVWLPDSSGFIYTVNAWPGMNQAEGVAPRNQILHYDLTRKTSQVVAADSPSTICPALSPDGKHVAFARVTLEKGQPPTLQVIVNDFQGKEVQRSPVFPWGAVSQSEIMEEKYPQLFWAPRGNQVLVFANKHSGIYDLDRKAVQMLGAARPLTHGTTPIRPDGKGFLLNKEGRTIVFVDWAGKERPITLPRETESMLGRHGDVLDMPAAICWTRWEGDVAIATWKKGQLRIDTARLTATLREPASDEWSVEGREIQELYTFPDGKTKVAVLYLKSYRDFRDAGLPTVTVELLGPDLGQRRTLIPETAHCGLFPAPNKAQVALRYFLTHERDKEKIRSMILVVNQQGETVTEIETTP